MMSFSKPKPGLKDNYFSIIGHVSLLFLVFGLAWPIQHAFGTG